MPSRIDHLIVFTPVLEQGMDWVEQHLGVRPQSGGRHPDLGTHNALLGLGPDCYLEVMAPDPRAERPRDFGATPLGPVTAPRLGTWVLRAEPIDAWRERAAEAGLGSVQAGHRDNPDGSRLSWHITEPFVFPCGGVVPFLIDWGATPHPGTRLPSVGALTGLAVEHPDPERVRRALAALDVDLPVTAGEAPGLTATIDTPRGPVRLGPGKAVS